MKLIYLACLALAACNVFSPSSDNLASAPTATPVPTVAPLTQMSKTTVGADSTFLLLNSNTSNVIYVADGANLSTYNVTDPTAPVQSSTIPIPTTNPRAVQGMVLSGTKLFVTGYFMSYFQTFDVTTPLVPVQIGTNGGSNANSHYATFSVIGNYAFGSTFNSSPIFRVIDMSSPATPSTVASIASFTNVPNRFLASLSKGNYVYTAGFVGLDVIDATTPTSPTQVASLTSVTNTAQEGLAIKGNTLYMTGMGPSVNSLFTVDISTPASPTLVTTTVLSSSVFDPSAGVYGSVAITGNQLYAGTDVIYRFDISSPTAPALLGTKALDGMITALTTDGHYLYALTSMGSFYILDLGTGFR